MITLDTFQQAAGEIVPLIHHILQYANNNPIEVVGGFFLTLLFGGAFKLAK